MDNVKKILQEIFDLEGYAMNLFLEQNPECFENKNQEWLYPRLLSFFNKRPHNSKVDELLQDLSYDLSSSIHKDIYKELRLIDLSQSADEAYVEAFILKLTNNESNNYKFQKLKSPYKTKEYSIALKSINSHVLQNLTMEFGKTEHPYILAELANNYMYSNSFINAIPLLYCAAKQITTYPHKYWNSEYGMIGAVNVYRHLLNLTRDTEVRLNVFKLYYLHLTRLINITKDKLILTYSYSNRAFLCQDIQCAYAFSPGVNPDLFYISDLWYAHFCGQPEVPFKITKDFYMKSLTMYQNASLYVNDSGGYKEIEERSYNQIVREKNMQSTEIAIEYLKQFKCSACCISRKDLNYVFQNVEHECHHDFFNLRNRVLNFKTN